jgi:polyhydroxyalkanoate synthesis repressor PhaR
MPVIKRYSNRKLYDTDAKQYITLDRIAELIRKGEEVHVIDNATGDDLTTITLTQIIFELEKKQSGFLPRSLLNDLIQAGGDRLSSLQRSISARINFFRQVDEEIRRRIQTLISQGEIPETEGIRLIDRLMALSSRSTPLTALEKEHIEQEVERVLVQHEIPTHDDIYRIVEQLEDLAAILDEITGARIEKSDKDTDQLRT